MGMNVVTSVTSATRYSIHDTGVYDSSTCRAVRNIEFRRKKLVKIVSNIKYLYHSQLTEEYLIRLTSF